MKRDESEGKYEGPTAPTLPTTDTITITIVIAPPRENQNDTHPPTIVITQSPIDDTHPPTTIVITQSLIGSKLSLSLSRPCITHHFLPHITTITTVTA
jgi:hypothetical protein